MGPSDADENANGAAGVSSAPSRFPPESSTATTRPGDGFYPIYWGFGRDGSLVCALTDSIVIEASAAVRAGEGRAQ